MTRLTQYHSEDYGDFVIEEINNTFVIWWDFYEETDGVILEPDYEIWQDEIINDFATTTPFKDMPAEGIFHSFDDAYDYITNKFGEIE